MYFTYGLLDSFSTKQYKNRIGKHSRLALDEAASEGNGYWKFRFGELFQDGNVWVVLRNFIAVVFYFDVVIVLLDLGYLILRLLETGDALAQV